MKNKAQVKLAVTKEPVGFKRPGRQVEKDRSAGFYAADQHGNISVASHSLAKMLNYGSREEVLGLNLAEKLYESKDDRKDLLARLAQDGHVENYEVKMLRKDGTRVVLSAHCTLVCDANGEPVGVEGILEEVAGKNAVIKSKERPIPELVPLNENEAVNFDVMIKDPLTGLCNYQYFMTCLNTEIKRVERIFHPTCLMMIDLDNFAAYNQKCGREKGDELLKTVTSLLKDNLRSTDILCRQAQDQFLAILQETGRDEALSVAKKVKDAVEAAMAAEKITASIGMSRFIIGMSVQELLLQANLGLYMAKAAGKNEACLYG